MSKDFAKIVELHMPTEKDLVEKDDHPVRQAYADLNLLPLAKLCPQLGEVIPHQGKEPEGPQKCC